MTRRGDIQKAELLYTLDWSGGMGAVSRRGELVVTVRGKKQKKTNVPGGGP